MCRKGVLMVARVTVKKKTPSLATYRDLGSVFRVDASVGTARKGAPLPTLQAETCAPE